MNSVYPLTSDQIIYQTPVPSVNTQPYEALDYFWKPAVNGVLILPAHQETIIPKFGSTSPLQAGFVRAYIEESKGQLADYRMTLPDGRGIHLLEFSDHYTLHWDKICPLSNPVEHINQDAPQYGPVLGILAIAGIVGFVMLLASGSN